MFDIKALYEAESTAHAVELLLKHPQAKIIAGGTDVLIQIREGRLAGCELVSIQKLDALRGVTMDEQGALRIGPLTTFSHITGNALIKEYIPVLGEAVDLVGGPQIRNMGTIGGNVCNGVTSADSASTLLAFDAVMEYTGPLGTRLTPIAAHYVSAGKTSLEHEELLTAILIPRASYEQCFGHYIKYAMRNALDIATIGCSVNARLSPDKRVITRARIAYGVAGPIPLRAVSAEAAAFGQPTSAETIEAVGKASLNDVHPRSSWRASKELRLHLLEELTKRALRRSIELAGGTL
jgi:xanthine dehydrogenase FAD-binding subunit